MITASSSKRNVTRYASFFKKLPSHELNQEKGEEKRDMLKQEVVSKPKPSIPGNRPVRERRPPGYLRDYIRN